MSEGSLHLGAEISQGNKLSHPLLPFHAQTLALPNLAVWGKGLARCVVLSHTLPFQCPRFTNHQVVSRLPTSLLSRSGNLHVLWKELRGRLVTKARLGLRPGGSSFC